MKKEYIGKTPEEILELMPLEKKAAQVLSSGFCCYDEVKTAMELGIGAMTAMWGNKREDADRFKKDVERFQKEADIPFLIGVDMETGVGQTVHVEDYATEFPDQMSLGAIADEEEGKRLAYLEGKVIRNEAVNLGWNLTYGPVADVNINPANPITNVRSVGENPDHVSAITSEIIRGMQEYGDFCACAKHFPGAGMQSSDSHFSLEKTNSSKEEMEAIHLKPFKNAVRNGIGAFMTNHAIYPMFDDINVATTSRAVITGVAREELGFEGIILTDAMAMTGLTAQDGDDRHMGTIRAIAAGCNVILGPYDVWNAPAAIAKAVRDGKLSEDVLNLAVLRVLRTKQRLGLFDNKKGPVEKLNGWEISKQIAEKSVTLIRDRDNIIPVDFTSMNDVMVMEPTHPGHKLSFGLYTNQTLIAETLHKDVPIAKLALISQEVAPELENELIEKASKADIVIVGTSFRSHSGQVGLLTEQQIAVVEKIVRLGKKVIAVVSNPYVAAQLPFVGTVICCYSTSKVSVQAASDVILGRLEPKGKLPVTIPDSMDSGNIEIVSHG